MSNITITIINNIYCRIDKGLSFLYPCLSYKYIYWKQGIYRKERCEITKKVIINSNYTYTGLIPRIKEHCNKNNFKLDIHNQKQKIPHKQPEIPGITLREDQKKLVDIACKKQRGIIEAPTGSGKTILQMAILSCFPNKKALFLCPSLSIIQQTYEELLKYKFANVGMLGGGNTCYFPNIMTATVQSFIKLNLSDYKNYFDIIIIDESHHLHKFNSTLSRILQTLNSPIRLGFTATPNLTDEGKLASESFLGPIIGKQTINESAELNILAKPKIKLFKTQFRQDIRDIAKYQDVYQKGIVENQSRNILICRIVNNYLSQGKTILIMVTKIQHGEILLDTFLKMYNKKIPFVKGDTETETRDKLKNLLNEKKINCIICTVVWKEGINIPSLDVIINASGGKSEILTLQKIGRGLRRTKEKEEVLIVDFFDPSHPYLISHFGERITLYMNNKWL